MLSEAHSWVYEWQTLIAGVMALIAGIGAVLATRHAATREIEAAERQIAYAKDAETRKLAREAKAACGLLNMNALFILVAAKQIVDSIKSEWEVPILEHEAKEFFSKIKKPDLSVVWSSLNLIGNDAAAAYVSLDHSVEHVILSWYPGINGTQMSNLLDSVVNAAIEAISKLGAESGKNEQILQYL